LNNSRRKPYNKFKQAYIVLVIRQKTTTMNSSSSTSSNIASSLTGIGLFIVTVAVSQWIQIDHNNKSTTNQVEEEDDEDYDGEEEEVERLRQRRLRRKKAFRKAFRQRQLSRRLSFQEFEDTVEDETEDDEEDQFWNNGAEEVDNNSTTIDDDNNRLRCRSTNHSSTDTEWDLHHSNSTTRSRHHNILSKKGSDDNNDKRGGGGGGGGGTSSSSQHQNKNRRLQQYPASSSIISSAVSSNNDRCIFQNDFHPKYQNWRHFEPSNIHDKAAKLRRKQKQQLLILQQQRQRQYQNQDAGEAASQRQQQQQQQKTPAELNDVVTSSAAAAVKTTSTMTSTTTTTKGTSSEDQSNNVIAEHPQTTIKVPLHDEVGADTDTHFRRSMLLRVDNGSDNSIETFSTSLDDDDDDDDEKISNDDNSDDEEEISPSSSFGSGNEFVWTGGTKKKKKKDLQTSMTTTTTTASIPKDDPPPPIPPPTRPPRSRAVTYDHSSSSSNNNNNNNSHINNKIHQRTNSDGRIGRFQRFYQMLTISDDDNIGEDSITGSKNNKIYSNDGGDDIYDNTNDADDDGNLDETQHRALRTEYNAQIMPEKLVLIRHGQSAGNVDEAMYAITPDNAMPLTDLGWDQARKAGEVLKEKMITSGESVHFIVSPYVRTVETFHGIVSAWCDPDGDEFACIDDHNRKVDAWYERLTELGLTWNEDSRIREQDFGNYQTPEVTKRAKEERHRFGAFYYRFNNGESGSDVFDRVSTFLDSLWRSFETNKSQNYVLITHGIVLRVLMARYFRYTISQLNMLANPKNCEMVVLGHSGDGRLDLEGRCALEVEEDPETKESHVNGYTFHKRLRILPKSHINTVKFRISPNDKV
jgi:broad specificity phosphatase PhoE